MIAIPTVARALHPLLFARKTGDEAKTSTTTLTDDAELLLPLNASATYVIEVTAIYDGATTGDIRFGLTVPAGATVWMNHMGLISTAAGQSASIFMGVNSTALSGPIGAAGAGSKVHYRGKALVRTGGTAGNAVLQWAQGASDPTATNLFTDSFMTAQRVT